MTVYVFRAGSLVPKGSDRDPDQLRRSDLPCPMISRIEPFESPVTGKEITSWRERDRDMAAVGAVDPRDMPPPEKMARGRVVQKREAEHGRRQPADDSFQWREPT